VNRLVPEAEFAATVRDLAERISRQAPVALSMMKMALNNSLSMSMAEALEYEALAQSVNFSSNDTREAMIAFIEKREPKFTGT
jgi:2-(1,2-epoxy-1,2-dihydrophenyl)acetyl-CoA isomerase